MNMSSNGESLTTNYAMPGTLGMDCGTPDNNEKQVDMLLRLCGAATNSIYRIFGNCITAIYPWNISEGLKFLGFSNGENYGNILDVGSDVINELRAFHPKKFN